MLPEEIQGTKKEETAIALTGLQAELLKIFFEKHFTNSKGLFNEPDSKSYLIKQVSQEFSISEDKLEKLYKKAKDEYFTSYKRLPAEALINQINAEAQTLKEETYNNSNKDIGDKTKIIMDVNDKVAKINQLYDISPVTNIYFKQEFKSEDLLNSDNFKIEGE